MKKGDVKTKRGFTIIEVSLVLAIAGLIFLMVFVALPSLQRGQRDAQRREAVMTFLEQLKKYQANNRGALPEASNNGYATFYAYAGVTDNVNRTSWQGFYNDYLGDNFTDPDGTSNNLAIISCGRSEGDDVAIDAACNNGVLEQLYNSGFPFNTGPANHVVVVVKQAVCKGSEAVKTSNPRNVAVLYRLEGAGIYCGNT